MHSYPVSPKNVINLFNEQIQPPEVKKIAEAQQYLLKIHFILNR